MVKPARKSSLNGLSAKLNNTQEQQGSKQPATPAKKRSVVSVGPRGTKTTGRSPRTLRLTENDETELIEWLDELTDARGKQITPAKLFRGLIHMRDQINQKKLLEAIRDIS